MKNLIDHINEALKIGKNLSKFSTYSCRPANRDELKEIIKKRIKQEGSDCDLNDIDTSLITNMSELFYKIDFTGDISKWDVSNVVNMTRMFAFSKFDGDISTWDTSKVTNMSYMFYGSSFNGDISKWNISNVTNMRKMFISSKFRQDISNWKINDECDTYDMFRYCVINDEYKPKTLQQ